MTEPTADDKKRDLAADLERFGQWGTILPLICPEVGWFREAGLAALRRAIAAERRLAVAETARDKIRDDLGLLHELLDSPPRTARIINDAHGWPAKVVGLLPEKKTPPAEVLTRSGV